MGRRFYRLIVMAAVAAVIYLYAFRFDQYSEAQLVRFAYGWLPALVFGTYGLAAEAVAEITPPGQDIRFGDALGAWFDQRPILKSNALLRSMLVAYLAPLMAAAFFVRTLSPFALALMGAAAWLIFLKLFFDLVFPLL